MPKLTKRVVEMSTPKSKDFFLWDTDAPGFGVRVLPSGKRSYLVQFRDAGRTRRISIGKHGAVTVEQARKRAQDLMGQVARGDKPADQIALERRTPTVATLCEKYLTEHAIPKLKPSTLREYRSLANNLIKPRLGSFKVSAIKRADIAAMVADLSSTPYRANRSVALLSAMFNQAEVWGWREEGTNPCRLVKKHKEKARERFLSQAEINRLISHLNELEETKAENSHFTRALKFLILTGCRLSEVLGLQWEWIREGVIEFPDSKTGAKRIPLSPQAQALLLSHPKTPECPFVFQGKNEGQPIVNLEKPWRRIRSQVGLDD